MDFKNPVNLEHISSSLSFKSRVISAFGLGVLASLLVFSLLPSVNAPPTITSLSSSSFFSWVFSINNPPSNSTDTLLAPPDVNITTPSDLGTTHFMNSSDLLGRQPISVKTQDANSSESSFSERSSDLDDARFKNPTEESQNLNLGADHALVLGQITIGSTPLNNGSAESAASFPISDEIQDGISSKSSFPEQVSDLGNAHFENSTGEPQNPNLELVMTENAALNNSAEDERKDLGSTAEENRNVSDDSGSAKVQGEVTKEKCNIFNGRWVRDEREALYDAGSCPYIDSDFNCRKNGRPDDDFFADGDGSLDDLPGHFSG
ncbi:uncharacterized protein A4U43_C01F26620 [Asparagus officinalis]|uniref:Trichome birefringence-like N-terminal domain-containing protein n=1 Tax=Asparagus officinalis TaxID=4686 RepID=A0A5P1FSC3_ASPOF|nr:protein trichome birefringence-like 2 [Asparagus officinalis]ONK81216.1 uncharacterized protein A4U43_C01F26620 [Asparagus officinalis]